MAWDFGRFAVAGVVCLDQLRPLVRLVARGARFVPYYRTPGVVRLATCGVVFACLAGVWFSAGDLLGALLGSVLLLLVLLTDTAVGVRDRRGELDAWMTGLVSHVRELPVIIGVAAGGAAAGVDHVWVLAALAYGLEGVRESVVDSRWVANQNTGVTDGAARPPSEPMVVRFDPSRSCDSGPPDATLTTELLRDRVRRRPRHTRLTPWCAALARRAGRVLTAGARKGGRLRDVGQADRFTLIALTALLGNAAVTFVALSVLALAAAAVELAYPAESATTPLRGGTNE